MRRALTPAVLAVLLCLALSACLPGPGIAEDVDLSQPFWGPHCYVYRDAPQTVPNAENTVVVFSPAQVGGDYDDMFDPADPTVLTMPGYDAIWLVVAQCSFDWPGGSGHTSVYIEEYTASRGTWERRAQQRIPSPNAGQAMVSVSVTIGVDAGDKVRMVVRQTSGGPLAIAADSLSRPKLAAVFLRPQYGEVTP